MTIDTANRPSRKAAGDRPDFLVSFEFFPPKTDAMEERFWESIGKRAPLHPRARFLFFPP